MTTRPDYRRATNMAYELLQRLNISTLPVTIFPAITQFPNLRVVSYSELCYRQGISYKELFNLDVSEKGFIIREKHTTQAFICYNDKIDPEIVRFTLAHELGHYCLDHSIDDSLTDKEANCFARNFLCPIPVTERFGLDDVGECCDIFDITPPAAEVALDKRRIDRRNIEAPLYKDIFQRFGLEYLTKEAQLKRFSARAVRAFTDFSKTGMAFSLAI